MDLAQRMGNQAMIQAIINEEKRRRDHGFKRSVIPPNPSITAEQKSNENDGEVQVTGDTVEEEEEEEEDSGSSDEEDEN
jgi:hypothetical protein